MIKPAPSAPVALVTGASAGIGAATGRALAAAGFRVFGASRSGQAPNGVEALRLDVRADGSAEACVDQVLARAGRLDVLLNNAGVMTLGPVEEVPLTDAVALFETNFWGVARMVNAALPTMRAARAGRIINVGSIAGSVAVPMNGFYAATKHALVGYSEALRHEVMAFGIHVSLVEPGDVRSSLWDGDRVAAAKFGDYEHLRARVLATLTTLRQQADEAELVAAAIVRVATEERPKLRNYVGATARRIPMMRALMPRRMFERGTRRRFGLE